MVVIDAPHALAPTPTVAAERPGIVRGDHARQAILAAEPGQRFRVHVIHTVVAFDVVRPAVLDPDGRDGAHLRCVGPPGPCVGLIPLWRVTAARELT